MASEKYVLQPEHEAQLPTWRDRWIKNAMSTGPLGFVEKARVRTAILGLYEAAGLKQPKPENVIFLPSPLAASFANGFCAALLYRRGKSTSLPVPTVGGDLGSPTLNAIRDAVVTVTGGEVAPAKLTLRAPSRDRWWALGGCSVSDVRALAHAFGDEELIMSCARAGATSMTNGGNQWSGWVAFLSFFRYVAKLPLDYSRWRHYETAALAGPRWMHPDYCLVSDLPLSLTVDEQNRPHGTDGPYCQWADGTRFYSWHGTMVPEWVVESPEEITVEKITAEKNAELRRVMTELYGPLRYMRETGMRLVHEDAGLGLQGSAPRALLEDRDGQRWLVGSDGSSGRVYSMPVPRTSTTCREAHEAISGVDEASLVGES